MNNDIKFIKKNIQDYIIHNKYRYTSMNEFYGNTQGGFKIEKHPNTAIITFFIILLIIYLGWSFMSTKVKIGYIFAMFIVPLLIWYPLGGITKLVTFLFVDDPNGYVDCSNQET